VTKVTSLYSFGLNKVAGNFKRMNRAMRNTVYYNQDTNNLLLITPILLGTEPGDEMTVLNVLNFTVEPSYSYLANVLNTERDLLIDWSQCPGTTSDYTIIYGQQPELLKDQGYHRINRLIKSIYAKHEPLHYKFTQFKDGEFQVIHPADYAETK
jgi:hypothetical protein